MGARGPKSSSELTTVARANVETFERPQPPAYLNEEEAEEWRQIVNALAAAHVPRVRHGELANYCRHTITQRRIDHLIQQVEREEDLDLERWNRLLAMRERETRAAASLSVRLGFAYSTSYEKGKKPQAAKRSLKADW